MQIFDNWKYMLIGALTLGLSPWVPEPHVWQKIKWLVLEPETMQIKDWLDFAMHTAPWVFLIRALAIKARGKKAS